jgi:hypothetical protein
MLIEFLSKSVISQTTGNRLVTNQNDFVPKRVSLSANLRKNTQKSTIQRDTHRFTPPASLGWGRVDWWRRNAPSSPATAETQPIKLRTESRSLRCHRPRRRLVHPSDRTVATDRRPQGENSVRKNKLIRTKAFLSFSQTRDNNSTVLTKPNYSRCLLSPTRFQTAKPRK